jgi:predicted Zn-dependent protease
MKSIAITIAIMLLSRIASADTIQYKHGHPVRWDTDAITVTLDPSLETLGVDAYAVVEDAFIDWTELSGIGIDINFEYAECTYNPYWIQGIQAENCVMAMTVGNGWVGHGIATTTQDGEITNADIIFDPQEIVDYNNLACTVMHEVGHFFGLGHSDDNGSIMYGYVEDNCQRGITETDASGLSDLYAIDDDVQCSVATIGTNSGSIWNLLFYN